MSHSTNTDSDKLGSHIDTKTSSLQLSSTIAPFDALTILILGASGDLTYKKVIPSLFSQFCEGHLPADVNIVGYARSELSNEEFRDRVSLNFKNDPHFNVDFEKASQQFLTRCHYISGQYDVSADYARANKTILDLELTASGRTDASELTSRRIFYFALPSQLFDTAAKHLRENVMPPNMPERLAVEPETPRPLPTCSDPAARGSAGAPAGTPMANRKDPRASSVAAVVEKPLGRDLSSWEELDARLHESFSERQLFRIDHYLAKSLVEAITLLRFGNAMFERVWSAADIDLVTVTVKETQGVAGRAGYFESAGIIRDLQQNHQLQLLALLAMERPRSLHAADVADAKAAVLRDVRAAECSALVLGQYDGYREERGVAADSNTATFAALGLTVDNERWRGTKWVLKSGKALDQAKAEIRIQFRPVADALFAACTDHRNELVIQIQPHAAVYVKLLTRDPAGSAVVSELDLSMDARWPAQRQRDAYEKVLIAAVRGDKGVFVRADECREAWRIFTPLLHYAECPGCDDCKDMPAHTPREPQTGDAGFEPVLEPRGRVPVYLYSKGSRGPIASDVLMREQGLSRSGDYTWPGKQ